MNAKNQLYFINQKYADGQVIYEGLFGTDIRTLKGLDFVYNHRADDHEGIMKRFLPIQIEKLEWDEMEKDVISDVFKALISFVRENSGVSRDEEAMALSFFILLTYFYQIFEAIPNLWLHVTSPHMRFHAESWLQNLCYNAHVVQDGSSFNSVAGLIDQYNPTVIFSVPSRTSQGKLKPFYDAINHRRRSFLCGKDEPFYVYSPKIVISERPLVPPLTAFTVPITQERVPPPLPSNTDYSKLRRSLLVFIKSLTPLMKSSCEETRSVVALDDLRFPFIVMMDVLVKNGIIKEEEVMNFRTWLNEVKDVGTRDIKFTLEDDTLIALYLYMDEKGVTDDELRLQDVYKRLCNTSSLSLLSMNKLTRILNKYALVKERWRRSHRVTIVDNNIFDSKETMIARQEVTFYTYVKLDLERLKAIVKKLEITI